jgi:cytochrome c553
MNALAFAGLVAGLAGLAPAAFAQQPAPPAFAAPNLSPSGVRGLAGTCAPCHGTDGRAAEGSSVPGLAGRPREDLVRAMGQFRTAERPSTLMGQLAKGFTDAEIDALAGYFAAVRR